MSYAAFAQRCDRLAWALTQGARHSARRPGGMAVRQHARAARGVLRRAARRRGAAAVEHPARPGRDPVRARRQRRGGLVPSSRSARPRARRAPRRARRRVRGAARGAARRPVPRAGHRRGRAGRALLHVRVDRHAEGRAALAPRPVSPCGPQRVDGRAVGRRHRHPHHPALPRERLGDAALRDRPRRRARAAAAFRSGRGPCV